MSALSETNNALRGLEAILLSTPQGELDSWTLEPKVREVLLLLAREEPRWISAGKAKRLLGARLDEAVPTWARLGLLRSKISADGQLEVRLDDVLHQRLVSEALLGIGGDDLTPEELRIMREARRGTNSWDRERTEQRRR